MLELDHVGELLAGQRLGHRVSRQASGDEGRRLAARPIVHRRGWAVWLLAAWALIACAAPTAESSPVVASPLERPAVEPPAADLARYAAWADADDEQGRRLVTAFDRALASIAAGFLTEGGTAMGGGVIGPRHVAEWAEVIAGVRASPYRQTFQWARRVHPTVLRDAADDPISYRLVVAVTDRSRRLSRATGEPVGAGEPARGCLFVTLHEEGGTLKVIDMRRAPDRFCPHGWPA